MKKKLIIGITSILILGGGVLASVLSNKPTSADTSATQAQVQAQQSELNNHEARITNTEGDVKDLQDKTSTPPSTTRVEVPVSQPAPIVQSTPAPEPQPKPAPVTASAYEQIPIENSEDVDCKYTYSDGTTYQWHWKTVEYNQGTKFTHTSGLCDSRAIGQRKPSS